MDPKLKINRDTRISRPHLSYTRKQIMEEYYPELWSNAQVIAGNLLNLQKKVIKLLPESKRLLPSNVEALKDEEAQANFLNYIRLRALYVFSNGLWHLVEDQCRSLAKAHNNDIRYDLEDSKEALKKTLDIASAIPFDDLTCNQEYGLLELYEIQQKLDTCPLEVLCPGGMLGDIVGVIESGNIFSEYWLSYAINDIYPTSPNILELLKCD